MSSSRVAHRGTLLRVSSNETLGESAPEARIRCGLFVAAIALRPSHCAASSTIHEAT
jgi:hypothetical protein